MFNVIKEADLHQTEIARFLGVSRVTVNHWVCGHRVPHRILEMRVHKLLDAVRRAVDSGDFPVPPGLHRSERAEVVRKVLAKHLGTDRADKEH